MERVNLKLSAAQTKLENLPAAHYPVSHPNMRINVLL